MSLIELLFFSALFYGYFNIFSRDSAVLIGKVFSIGLVLIAIVYDSEGFGKYITRLIGLCIFGALVCKLNPLRGLMLLFLSLLIMSMLMAFIDIDFLIAAIIVFPSFLTIVSRKFSKDDSHVNRYQELITLFEKRIVNYFMPVMGIAVAFPFGLLIAKVPIH